jgi:hypothetical protein
MSEDHAPLGSVAFRCEPYELLNSAVELWGQSTQMPNDLAERLVHTAEWYEGCARTLEEIRCLPTDRLVNRVQRYT